MKELLDTLAAWQAEGTGRDVGRAVVVRTFGSAPRPEGAVLLYADDGRIAGSVSGGCVEGAAAEEIERARATGHARVIRYGISDEQAWDVGLACGGTIDVLVEPVAPAVADRRGARARVGPDGHGVGRRHAAPRRLAAGPEFGPHQPGEGRRPQPSSSCTDDGRLDRHARRPGAGRGSSSRRRRAPSRAASRGRSSSAAGRCSSRSSRSARGSSSSARVEVARSLVRLARELGYETVVIDGRAAFATPGAVPGRRPARRRLAGRGRRRDRPRPERRGRGPHPRRQVRRAGDRRGARDAAAATSAPSAAAKRRPTAGPGCWRPGSRPRRSPGCAARSGSTLAVGRRPRPRWRSWPRSSRPDGAAGGPMRAKADLVATA